MIPNGVADVSDTVNGQEGPLGAFSFYIDGFEYCNVPTGNGCPDGESRPIKDGSVLRVSVYVWYSTRKALIIQDEAILRNALSMVGWSKGAYKVGETAIVHYETPVATYKLKDDDTQVRTAYFLSVVDCNTNTPLSGFNRKPLATTQGQFQIPITDDLFSNDVETCQNRLRATLYSELIRVDQGDTAIQPSEAQLSKMGVTPPEVTSIKFDKPEYFEGDTVTINWEIKGNITKIHVTVTIDGMILFDKDVADTDRSLSVIASRTGTLMVEVTAYTYCVPSTVEAEYATIGNVYPGLCTVYPDLPQCKDDDGLDWVALIVAILVIVLVVIVFFVVYMIGKTLSDSLWLSMVVATGVAGTVLLGVLAAGLLDVLLRW